MVTSLRHAQEVPTQERFLTPRRNAHRPSQATMQSLGGLLQMRGLMRGLLHMGYPL